MLIDPWKLLFKEKKFFFIWFIFTVFAGQLGLLVNMINRWQILASINIDATNGFFYAYSIALLGSILGPLFNNILETSPTKFKSIKLIVLAVSIFILFFAGILYSKTVIKLDSIAVQSLNNSKDEGLDLTTKNDSSRKLKDFKTEKIETDLLQLSFSALVLFLVTYIYCLTRLDFNYDEFKHLDDFSEKDNKKVEELQAKGASIQLDSKGNKL